MCQSSQSPVQNPEAACPLHVAHQPALETSIVTTTCRDTCSNVLRPVKRQGPSRGWMSGNALAWWSRKLYRGDMPISGLGSVTCAEVVPYEVIRVARLRLWMPYAPGASESVSSCLWRNSVRSAWTGRARWWDAPPHSPSLTPYWEKSFSARGRACSFPNWPEAPTGWGAGAPGPCDRTTVLARGPCSRQLRILMPTSHNGARAPSVTFAKTRGDRESPKGRTLYCHAWPSNTNQRSVSRANRDMKVSILQVDRCKPILGLDASDDALLRQHLERKLVQGPIQDSQIQNWPEATIFLGYNEVRAVKPLLLLGWREWPDCILCQEDRNLLVQDRCISDCHRSLENAAELGRSPGELNRIAESDCVNEPAGRVGQCKPHPQTPYKWHQRDNRHTRGGAAEGSRAG